MYLNSNMFCSATKVGGIYWTLVCLYELVLIYMVIWWPN